MKLVTRTAALTMILVLAGATAAYAAEPANDNRADATVISSLPYTDSANIALATVEEGEPTNCGGSNTVWYRFMAPADGTLVATTQGSDFAATLSVFEGSLTSMSSVGCDYSYSASSPAVEAFDAVEGETYFVRVGKNGGGANVGTDMTFGLHWQPTLNTTIDRPAWLAIGRDRATVTGIVDCSEPLSVRMQVSVSHRVDGVYNSGYTEAFVTCDGPTPWQVNLRSGYDRPFSSSVPLDATVNANVSSERLSDRATRELPGTRCSKIGTIGDDTIDGTTSGDRICALAGDDTIQTLAGDDIVYAWDGADTVDTGRGSDSVSAGSGRDTVELGKGNDSAGGGDGRDRIYGEDGADRIAGNADPDELRGGPGSDTCIGGDGRDAYSSCETKR